MKNNLIVKKTKKKKNYIYDIVIYTCLFAAIICLCFGGKLYFNSLSEESTIKDEVKSALKEINSLNDSSTNQEESTTIPEPEELKNVDKVKLINNYLNDILDEIEKDDFLNGKIINSWGKYEITDISYYREIFNDYYEYHFNIKINNDSAILPVNKNDNLSNEEYSVISLKAYIEKNSLQNSFYVKKISE